ncbi:MAG TPA: TetR/AcrR family transcriptional regulator [Coriobacteriia bacterium]
MARIAKPREERREELLDAATRLFADRGVADTAVSDIVAAVSVSQGTFYWYFESKEAVVDAVVERVSRRIVAGVEAIAGGDAPAVDKLLRMRDVLLSIVEQDRELLEFFHREGNEAFHDRVSRESVRRLVPAFERVIEQGVGEGSFHIKHTDDAPRFLAALLDVTDPFDVFAEPERLGHHVEAVTEFALRGLGCDEATVAAAMARRAAGA